MNMIEYAKIARVLLQVDALEKTHIVSTKILKCGTELHLRKEHGKNFVVCTDSQYEGYRAGKNPEDLKMTVIKGHREDTKTVTEKVYKVWMNFNGEIVEGV